LLVHRIRVDGTEFRWTREVAAAWGSYRIKQDRRNIEINRAVK
jgi:hypothetical protein